MINNIDIEREKSVPDSNKDVLNRLNEITKRDLSFIHSRAFSYNMQWLLNKYGKGYNFIKKPLLLKRAYITVLISKFNSYDFLCSAKYDDYNKQIIFIRRHDR